ncbi:MAG: hypothetical protein P1P88_04330 [Bacteroidales bacterium]|nr:hypothetical protein [Bacteroidales bacterium]
MTSIIVYITISLFILLKYPFLKAFYSRKYRETLIPNVDFEYNYPYKEEFLDCILYTDEKNLYVINNDEIPFHFSKEKGQLTLDKGKSYEKVLPIDEIDHMLYEFYAHSVSSYAPKYNNRKLTLNFYLNTKSKNKYIDVFQAKESYICEFEVFFFNGKHTIDYPIFQKGCKMIQLICQEIGIMYQISDLSGKS